MSAQLPPSTVVILKMPQRGGKENIGKNYFHVCKEVLINHMFHVIVQVRVVLRKTVVGDITVTAVIVVVVVVVVVVFITQTQCNSLE